MLTVHKFYTDSYLTNKNIFRALNLDHLEWNQMERDFLTIMDYAVVITESQYQECLRGVESFFKPQNRHVIRKAELVIES